MKQCADPKEKPASLCWASSIYIAQSGQAAGHDKTGGTAELKHCTGVTASGLLPHLEK